MKKLLRISILLIFNFSLHAQNTSERGVEVPKSPQSQTQVKTWAILVGVSDYQNVRDLQYADRDAEVFYGYLNEVAKVPKENIFLFTNKKANLKNVSTAITKLDTLVKSGDKFIFFFAGHGDIEAENRPDETALLLLHDSPDGNYLAAQDGYIKLIDLKEVFDKFTERNVSVQFYADACRSGAFNLINNTSKVDTLKGGVKGRNRFLNGIQQPWLNQIKYVSCQVNENSLEGAEYSCGRGLFSLHLIDGLMGMADTEKDGKVTFAELRQYVDKMVRTQAKPRSQNPQKVNGDDNEDIALVDSVAFVNYQLKQKEFTKTHLGDCTPFLSGTNIKGDSTLLTDIDPQFREDYAKFYKNLKTNKLLYPESDNAKKSFLSFEEKLKNSTLPKSTNQFLKIVAGNMKADLIEGLQKGCMNIIKPLLTDVDELIPVKYSVYDTAHNYMIEVLNLLQKEHFLYKQFLSRDLYLQAALILKKSNDEVNLSDLGFMKADSILKLALLYEPEMPYIYSLLGDISRLLGDYKQALLYYKKGFTLMPNSLSFAKALYDCSKYCNSTGEAVSYLLKFPSDASANYRLAQFYMFDEKNDKKSRLFLNQSLKLYKKQYDDNQITERDYYFNLANVYYYLKNQEQFKIYADKCYQKDTMDITGLLTQVLYHYDNTKNIELIKPYLIKMIKYYPEFGTGRAINSVLLMYTQPKEALKEAKYSLKSSPNNYWGLLALTSSLMLMDSVEQAYKYAKYATKIYPKAYLFWNLLGAALEKVNNSVDALAAYSIADSLNLNDANSLRGIGTAYTNLEKYSKAIPYLLRAYKIKSSLTYVCINLGLCYWNIPNKLDSSIYFFKKEIENNPLEIYSYVYLGLCYKQMGTATNITKALEYFKIAVQKAKEIKNVKLMRETYTHSLKLVNTSKDFQERDITLSQEITDIIDDKKSDEFTNIEIVKFYNKRKEAIKTIPYLLKLCALDSNNKIYKRELFLSYFNTSQYKKADTLLSSVDKTTDSASRKIMNGYFGIVKYRVKDYTSAIQYLQNAFRDTLTLLIYSSTLSRLQKFEDAMKIIIPILKNNPLDLNYNLNYGLSLLMQKKYSETKAVLEKCEILAPKDIFVYFRWASFYAVQDKEHEAIEYIKKAIELGFKDFWRFEDEEFDGMRDNKEFQALINK